MFKRSISLLICAVYFAAAANNMTTYNYKTVNGTNVQLNVYTPPTAAPTTGYPVFFAIHGGGYYSGAKTGAFSSQELAEVMSRGWVLVSIDYRLMPSVFLEDIVQDMKDAYAWVRTELPKKTRININKITLFGQSAGGGLATMGGYLLSPRPKAIIGMYPGRPNWTDPFAYWPNTAVNPTVVELANNLSTPLRTRYTISGSSDQRLRLYTLAQANRKMGWLAVTHNPNLSTATIKAKLKALSSSENVDANYPPTYLAHGLADTTVPYNQSVMLANSLAKKNITHVLNLVPGANHNFDGSATYWNDYVYPAFEFVQQYM